MSVFRVEAVTWLDAVVPLMLSLLLMFAPKQLRKALMGYMGKGSMPVILLLLSVSCSASKDTKTSQPPQRTLTEQTVQVASKAEVKPDSAAVQVKQGQLTPGASFRQQGKRAESIVSVDKTGLVTSKCNCKGESQTDTVTVYVRTETPVPSMPAPNAGSQPTEPVVSWWIIRNIVVPILILFVAAIILLVIARLIKLLFLQLFQSKPSGGIL
ncbi:hypothetical protein [Pontibacter pamirensis]|uniref:hypothetical protein n=1 Tax=Pontibacter pamirensis TaxID=2562824 RepID=UPI00138A59C6|nr:hypothetical protein [Pontibacter pamirensis]